MAKIGIAAVFITLFALLLLNSPLLQSGGEPPAPPQSQAPQEPGRISYFAFGSNLDESVLAQRVGGSFPEREAAYAPNYRIVFSGPASIEQSEGSMVYGALYKLTDAQMKLLDRSEGVPTSYVRIPLEAVAGGRIVRAQAYQFARQRNFSPPSNGYLQIIRKGYSDLGHPNDAYDKLAKAAAGN